MQPSASSLPTTSAAAPVSDEGAPPVHERQRKHKHSRAHKAEYALARILEKTVSAMPERAADIFGKNVGLAVHKMGIRRDVVEDNLRLAFPDRDDAWITDITKKTFEHLGR